VFAAPYVDMTASLAVKVALGFGLPVITTFLDQALEQAGARVTRVPPQDVPALADAIAALPGATGPQDILPAVGQQTGWEPLTGVIERLLEKTRSMDGGAGK
jgi:hypothetical protein